MSRLGPYTLIERVGRGGMGEVHIARRDGASTLCVLKQLRERAEGDQLFRLKREAHVLSQLAHPNIGRLIDAGVDGDTFYLALELIPGQTLRRILKRLDEKQLRFPPEIAVEIGLEILAGLAYAHDQTDPEGRPLELVHRDLSPNNVMLSYEGRTKIIDFGIASGRVDDFRTMPGTILGTMRYISPEQALSKPVDRRSDIYTVGTLLYEMLSGIPVVQKGDQNEILDSVLRRRPEPFSQVASDVPLRLWPVVAKSMEKRAQDRFDTAHAFEAALREASKGLVLPSAEKIGRFLEEIFPEELHPGRILAPDENTHSVDGDTDRSEASETASDEQPTQVEENFGAMKLAPPKERATTSAKRARQTTSILAIIAIASAMIALVMALPGKQQRAAHEPPAVSVRPTPSVKVIPKEQAPEPVEPVRAIAAPPPVKRVPRVPAKIDAPRSGLRAQLQELRQSPDNMQLMVDLHGAILRRSYGLPLEDQTEIKAVIDAALRAGDPDGLARGLDLLERSARE